MMGKRKKLILVLIPVLVISIIALNSFFTKSDFKLLETSLLTILRNVAQQNMPQPPDLGIDKITIRKISDPTENFNYYRYKATVIIHNYGGKLSDARVVLHGGDTQQHILIKNTPDGFSLGKNQNYIVRGYEIIFDGIYNGGNIPFQLEVVDKADYDESNNSYTVSIFESSPKIGDISIDGILDDGTFVLDFDEGEFTGDHDFAIAHGDSAVFEEEDMRYDEIYISDKPYEYYRIRNSFENISGEFEEDFVGELEAHFVEFVDEAPHYVYIKAVNPENGYYAVSNLLLLPSQEKISRAQFAKLFVEYAGIEIFDEGVNYFEDIYADQWYAPYVQTIYNLGLVDTIDFKYSPTQQMSRASALKIILDYFDGDLTAGGGSGFNDVPEDHEFYPYISAFYASGKGSVFGTRLNPDEPATKNYLKYLVYEYTKGY